MSDVLTSSALAIERGGRRLVDAVDLAIAPGEILGIVGPNGAGKSTLLRALCGDLPAAAGDVLWRGHSVSRWSLDALGRARAVMLQSSTVTFGFSARQVIALGAARFAGERAAHGIADRILHELDLGAFAERSFPTLSGGEQRRVLFWRALAQLDGGADVRPRLLFLDEPTAHLDLQQERRLLALVAYRVDAQLGVVVVLHDLNLALAFCDRVVVMHAGRCAAQGAPATTLSPALISRVFGVTVEYAVTPSGHSLVHVLS